MYKLTITKENGDTYWVEHFNSQADADKWLAEEQTRSYWNRRYASVVEYIGPTPEEINQREQEKAARETERTQRIERIQASKQTLDRMTLPELREVVADIIEHLGL